MFSKIVVGIIGVVLCAHPTASQSSHVADEIDAYVNPYVQSANFSGVVLVLKDSRVVFQKAYGFADREHSVQNKNPTRFHIASVSMQFTAAAILRLVDQGLLSLDTHVGEFAPGIAGGDKITIRDLLLQRSGVPDINALPGYADILQHHQTPVSLVAKVEGIPLLFDPGSKFLHEEHSAYNLLALIVEKKTGLPFAAAMDRLVFRPLSLKGSGADDDSVANTAKMAIGYEPAGADGLRRAATIHWSAKTGNASVYATAADEARWVDALFQRRWLSDSSRKAVLDTAQRVGYGWFRASSNRFNETAYSMNGRAPGFASFVLYLPNERITVVAFSNIYSSATSSIGNDVAAIARGLPYNLFHPVTTASESAEMQACAHTFLFGPDFYQSDAKLTLAMSGTEWSLTWPSGEISPLIPLDRDHFIDRSYWEEVGMEREASGCAGVLTYGRFRGSVSKQPN